MQPSPQKIVRTNRRAIRTKKKSSVPSAEPSVPLKNHPYRPPNRSYHRKIIRTDCQVIRTAEK